MRLSQCFDMSNPDHTLPPKYWVVHDRRETDVCILSADKCMDNSIHKYMSYLFPRLDYNEHLSKFYRMENKSCILIEIKVPESCIKSHISKGELE